MRRRIALAALSGVVGVPVASAKLDPQRVRRRLVMHLDVANPGTRVLRDQTVWLYLPMHRTHMQDGGEILTSSADPVVERQADGHTVLGLRWRVVAPHFTTRVAIDCSAWMHHDARMAAPGPNGEWRGAERFVESDDPNIARLAASLRGNGELASVRAIFEWVANNLRYAGFIAEELGAAYALRELRGDCTEFAYLTVALARAMGIAARAVSGYMLDRDAVVRAMDYHDWAEVFADGKWRLVDAQRRNWLEPAQHYVAFRQYRSEPSPRLDLAHRFRVEGNLDVAVW